MKENTLVSSNSVFGSAIRSAMLIRVWIMFFQDLMKN